MDNSIQLFKNNQFGDIRIVETNHQPLFCLADICRALDLGNPSQVKTRLNAKGIQLIDLQTLINNEGVIISELGNTKAIFISESNLYKCVFQSRKIEAEQFQDWVVEEVLPSIRKHGAYATDVTIEKMLNDPDFAIRLLTTLKEERSKRVEAEKTVSILTHVNKTYTCTEVAKELGFKSAIELNNKLHELGIQYKINGTWLPYTDYAQLALFEIKQEVLDNGKIIYHRRITGIGREYIVKLLRS